MNYKIIVDSCCDLPLQYRNDPHFEIVPLTIEFDNIRIIDDSTLNQKELLETMKKNLNPPKTSCPSPEDYMNAYNTDAENVYVVTLSEKLSGSYNSAVLGKNLFLEDNPDKKIKVFNSLSASSGEVIIALKIHELAESGLEFNEVCKQIDEFIKNMKTIFVIETLDNLKKNGRLSNVLAVIASVLNIKLVLGASEEGTIIKLGQGRGIKKAIKLMIETIEKEGKNLHDKVLSIAHCNCYQRALGIKEDLLKKCNFKDILIVDMAGISTVYANNGGIVIAF